MIVRNTIASLIAVLSARTAASQSYPGLSFDQTIHASRGPNGVGDTSVAVLHFLTSRGNIRVSVDGELRGSPGIPVGQRHAVILLTDSGNTVSFLNEDQKQYISLNPIAAMQSMRKKLEAMGGQIIIDTAATRLALDSLGPGPTVEGHPTLHYRLTTALGVSVVMRGTASGFEDESVQDILVAADLTGLEDLYGATLRLLDMGQTLGLAPEFMERTKALQKRMTGLPLRVTKVRKLSTNGRAARTATEDIAVSNIKRLQVPASAFAIPAGYTRLATPTMPGVNQ